MSDKELYNILENLRASEEEVYKPVEEDQTKIEKVGNKVKVTTDGDTTEFDDEETAAAFMGGGEEDDQMMGEAEEEVNEEQLDEVLPALAAAGGMAARAAGTAFGAGAADAVFGEDEAPELSTFDHENPSHRKCLQRGTPVVLSPEVCSDPKGDRTGVFVNLGKSGWYGKVMRNCDGKQVNVHLSDIVSADITNNSIYESLEDQFENVMEEITMTQTSNLENPENDTATVTAVGQEAADELAAMMANAGLNTGEYNSMDAPPVDSGVVDMGEPAAPEEIPVAGTDAEMEPEAPEELNAGAGCMEDNIMEDDIQNLDPALGKAIADGADIYDIMNSEETPQKDRDILQREYDEIAAESGYHADDDFESIMEVMAQRIYDMYGDGNMMGEDGIEDTSEDDKFMELVKGITAIPDRGENAEMEENAEVDTSSESDKFMELIRGIQAIPDRGEGRESELEVDVELDGPELSEPDHAELEIEEPEEEVEEAGERIHGRVEDRFAEVGERIHDRVAERGEETLDAGEEAIAEEPVEEERDVQHANTPDEQFARIETLIQAMAGGLNKPKGTYPKVAGGDNPMQQVAESMEDEIDEEALMESALYKELKAMTEGEECNDEEDDWDGNEGNDDPEDIDEAVEEVVEEELDESKSFLELYQAFQMRGEKRT